MDEIMIKANNLTYEYKNNEEQSNIALNNVNLEIKRGEFVAILGHNGSGKSTLAKHINALLLPTEGNLYVKGMDTLDEEKLWDIRSTAGMVFQNPDNQLVATIVEEDVAFGPENQGIEPEQIRERVDKALEIVEMTKYKEHAPHLLSGGQKQRIAIAGVLAMNPECIILDEPTAMLDPSGRIEVMETIKKLNREEGKTIVHITHYMDEAVDADRIVVMEQGEIVLEGTPKQVFSQVDKMKAFGLDIPQVTELSYKLRNRGIDIPTNILTVEEMVKLI
ncbi:energy-coupling factor transporter ATPase [Senegalia massiliensis]|uniref:Energy-coupling factor transporter ATPase n=1 Tax=Senegalia massiliensis TaxID=1720316 RepID=A0A845QWU2_9CLOT|nr:energy-coupling factor transporter ATPase [Senegalia massiliensis]NBI05622.1 energy-coupling factor transporter ATPase [Senegalia massiliensis]